MNSLEQNQRLITILSKKLEKNPFNLKALLLRSSVYIKLKDYSHAESDIFKIIKQNPNISTAYFLLGIISKNKKDFQQSLIYFSKTIEIDPDNVNALFFRAAVYNELGFFKEAIEDYYLALEKDSMKSSSKNTYKNIIQLLGTVNEEEENEKNNNLYNFKSNIDLDAEINNYVYTQLKTLYLQNQGNQKYNQGQGMQISQSTNITIQNNQNASNKEKDKENEVQEIYDPNDVNYNENSFLFGNNNTNIDNIIKNTNKYKKFLNNNTNDKNSYENEMNNNINKMNNINIKVENRYHNDGHITNDIMNNEGNVMISQEEDNDNVNTKINNNTNNIQNIYINQDELNNNNKKISQSQQQLNHLEINNKNSMNNINDNINNNIIPNKKHEKWEVYHNQGYSARKKDNFPLAIEYYTKALNLNPKYFKAYFNRGFAYDKLGQYDKAIYDYSKAIG